VNRVAISRPNMPLEQVVFRFLPMLQEHLLHLVMLQFRHYHLHQQRVFLLLVVFQLNQSLLYSGYTWYRVKSTIILLNANCKYISDTAIAGFILTVTALPTFVINLFRQKLE